MIKNNIEIKGAHHCFMIADHLLCIIIAVVVAENHRVHVLHSDIWNVAWSKLLYHVDAWVPQLQIFHHKNSIIIFRKKIKSRFGTGA